MLLSLALSQLKSSACIYAEGSVSHSFCGSQTVIPQKPRLSASVGREQQAAPRGDKLGGSCEGTGRWGSGGEPGRQLGAHTINQPAGFHTPCQCSMSACIHSSLRSRIRRKVARSWRLGLKRTPFPTGFAAAASLPRNGCHKHAFSMASQRRRRGAATVRNKYSIPGRGGVAAAELLQSCLRYIRGEAKQKTRIWERKYVGLRGVPVHMYRRRFTAGASAPVPP
jgi:hypothetical protein